MPYFPNINKKLQLTIILTISLCNLSLKKKFQCSTSDASVVIADRIPLICGCVLFQVSFFLIDLSFSLVFIAFIYSSLNVKYIIILVEFIGWEVSECGCIILYLGFSEYNVKCCMSEEFMKTLTSTYKSRKWNTFLSFGSYWGFHCG